MGVLPEQACGIGGAHNREVPATVYAVSKYRRGGPFRSPVRRGGTLVSVCTVKKAGRSRAERRISKVRHGVCVWIGPAWTDADCVRVPSFMVESECGLSFDCRKARRETRFFGSTVNTGPGATLEGCAVSRIEARHLLRGFMLVRNAERPIHGRLAERII